VFGDLAGNVDGIELPRAEIVRNAFVLWPLAELVPQRLHPVLQRTYAELWRRYDRDQRLWPIEFHWQGRRVSWPDTPDPEQMALR
jgi:2-amino-4-hydroxy-6-hydroxymethyldihydropteridine diphosphokinase